MAIVSGYQKMKDYIKQSSGYKLISRWANANTLECDDGKTLQNKVGGISGISSSLTANSTSQAASTNLTNQLYQNITEIGLSTTASSGNFSNTSIAPNVLTELTGYVNYSGNVLVDVNVFGWMAKNDGVYIEIVNEYSTIRQADYVASKEGRNDFHVILFSSTPSITIKVKHDSTSSRTFGATTNAIRI